MTDDIAVPFDPKFDTAHCCGRTHDECSSKPGPMCAGTLLANLGKTLTPAQAAALQRGADVAFMRDATSKSPHGDAVAVVLEELLGASLVTDEMENLSPLEAALKEEAEHG